MKVSTILVSREEAERKLEQYKSIQGRRRVTEDNKLQSLYAAISKGARVLNLAAAFKETGLNEKGEPRLAIARADWPVVHCHPNPYKLGGFFSHSTGTVGFTDRRRWQQEALKRNIMLPDNTFDNGALSKRELRASVPHIPPSIRPKIGLHNYHILFEVKEWESYPVDPFLMRRLSGMLFIVEAEWELTELEASLLSSMTQGT